MNRPSVNSVVSYLLFYLPVCACIPALNRVHNMLSACVPVFCPPGGRVPASVCSWLKRTGDADVGGRSCTPAARRMTVVVVVLSLLLSLIEDLTKGACNKGETSSSPEEETPRHKKGGGGV